MFNWPRSHFYGNAWLVPPKTSTSHSMASCGSIDQRSSMLERRSQISLPTLLSFSLTVGHKVAHLYAWRKWLHCRRKRSCRGRILFVTVYNIKRNGTDPHEKGQEKGEEHQERLWETLRKKEITDVSDLSPTVYEKEEKDAEDDFSGGSPLGRWDNRHQQV